MQIIQTRRRFMVGAAAAGAAGLIGTSTPAWAEPPPETTSVRLRVWPKIVDCFSPIYIT
jgi:NitT/TauT family transport system substrate-binding protein